MGNVSIDNAKNVVETILDFADPAAAKVIDPYLDQLATAADAYEAKQPATITVKDVPFFGAHDDVTITVSPSAPGP
jgi:hypothetical protein